jgi:hypothetical protein
MKVSTPLLVLASTTLASAWKIHFAYVGGKFLDSHGTRGSGCVNLRVTDEKLAWYDVEFKTNNWPDPNRVRLYRNLNCATLEWDSNKNGKNDLKPDRQILSYKVDHD